MNPLIAEFVGTALLILLGNGVVANVLLTRSKGNNGGFLMICFGWATAVFVGVSCVATYSGAHLNPAVTLALAAAGMFDWANVAGYIAAQVLGAMFGSLLLWIMYRPHYNATSDADLKLATFCPAPAIKDVTANLFSEVLGTFVLVFAILHMAQPEIGLGAISALPVALVVLAIGVSLGGTTGYAINPARDFGPRLLHALLPITGKRDSNWSYAWIPVVGPFVGGLLAVFVYNIL